MPGALPLLGLVASQLLVPPDERAMKPLELEAPPGLTLSAQSCLECHAASHEKWAGTRHAAAATNALFTASFGHQTRAWCLNCHAPLSAQRTAKLKLTALGAEGVNCAACHLREGKVLSSTAPSPAGVAAHPMRHEPALASSELCANCHDFDIPWVNLPVPVKKHGYSSVPMQDTYDEWKRSAAARKGVSCVGCHDAHAVKGARNVEGLRAEVRATRDGVELKLELPGAGHAFPTGDPFRALRLELCADEACATPIATKWLQRTIEKPTLVPPDGSFSVSVPTKVPPAWFRLVYSLGELLLVKEVSVEEREVVLVTAPVSPMR